jgi:DNA-binding transcriptional LysR family regulator
MELRHLRYFVGVAHHLNYSEASRACALPSQQSAKLFSI